MATREQVTRYIVKHIAAMLPGDDYNAKLTQERLEKMSNKEFDEYIRSLAAPEDPNDRVHQEILPFYIPNLKDPKMTMDVLMKVADDIDHPLFERLWLTDPQTGRVYLTPQRYAVFDLMVRRQAQTLTKKSSIPSDSRVVDELTGQVTGKSKGSKISFPEVAAQLAQDLTDTLTEEIKVRGGDRVAQVEFERQLIETGEASLDSVTSAGTLTRSTTSLGVMLRSMMIGTNLDEVP